MVADMDNSAVLLAGQDITLQEAETHKNYINMLIMVAISHEQKYNINTLIYAKMLREETVQVERERGGGRIEKGEKEWRVRGEREKRASRERRDRRKRGESELRERRKSGGREEEECREREIEESER